MRALVAVLILAGCATMPEQAPEVRTTVVQAPAPIAVPCFAESDRPKFPAPTAVDVNTATTEQLAAAELADALALEDFSRQVDALFLQCTTKGATP